MTFERLALHDNPENPSVSLSLQIFYAKQLQNTVCSEPDSKRPAQQGVEGVFFIRFSFHGMGYNVSWHSRENQDHERRTRHQPFPDTLTINTSTLRTLRQCYLTCFVYFLAHQDVNAVPLEVTHIIIHGANMDTFSKITKGISAKLQNYPGEALQALGMLTSNLKRNFAAWRVSVSRKCLSWNWGLHFTSATCLTVKINIELVELISRSSLINTVIWNTCNTTPWKRKGINFSQAW